MQPVPAGPSAQTQKVLKGGGTINAWSSVIIVVSLQWRPRP
jgi:hypothetical protein